MEEKPVQGESLDECYTLASTKKGNTLTDIPDDDPQICQRLNACRLSVTEVVGEKRF